MVETGHVRHDGPFVRFGGVHDVWEGKTAQNTHTHEEQKPDEQGKDRLVYTVDSCLSGPRSRPSDGTEGVPGQKGLNQCFLSDHTEAASSRPLEAREVQSGQQHGVRVLPSGSELVAASQWLTGPHPLDQVIRHFSE